MTPKNQFRTESSATGTEHQVEVELLLDDDTRVPGTLKTVGSVGAKVQFPSDKAPTLALAQRVRLRFSGPRLDRPVTATVSVQTRNDDEHARTYGFWFAKREEIETDLLPRLQGVFNRRGGYRVQPDANMPVLVTLESEDKRHRLCGPLLSISTTGMGIRASFEDEAAFAGSQHATACFALPGRTQASVKIRVLIRQRRSAGRHVQLGLVFEDIDGLENVRNERSIREYVVARQSEILRRRAG